MVKSHLVNGPHSAGIFADMSIDGPEIGTLVLIVDRAKNLPNRKTIGKQDPYCAARLGKEAKKTTTDIRGGQTPRWDQELRFTVHDGPDYYQLKLSVFNDDKKTELIGEAWIDLRDIIIPGGGQNDLWQNLSCKGKYAGDIRIEITYYDSRPKPEKPAAKPKPVSSDPDAVAGQHKVPKRRPLPSDPFTGQVPAQPPLPAASHAPTPPRSQPSVPREYIAELSTPDHSPAPYTTSRTHSPAGHHGATASPRQRHNDNYPSAPGSTYQTPSERDKYPVHPDDLDFSPGHLGHTPDRRYTPSSPYGLSPTDPTFGADLEVDRPPPPPAHRITPGGTPEIKHQGQTPPVMRKDVLRNEAHRQSAPPNAYPGRPVYRAYDSSPAAVPAGGDPHAGGGQQSSPPRHQCYDAAYEAHHRSMQPTVEDVPDSPGPGIDDYRRGGSRVTPLVEPDYQHNPSPPPLNLSGRNGAPPSTYNASYRQSGSPDYARSDEVPGHSPSGYSPRPTGNEHELPDTQLGAPANIPIPASLIPGMDPALSMEISQRVNEGGRHDRRHAQPLPQQQPPVGSMRGRRMNDRPPSYVAPPEMSQQHLHMPPYSGDAYERSRSPGGYAARGSSQHGGARRQMSPGHSPMGHNTIRRKSVSPAPVPESHRLSGVPFGPDDYNALNPALAVAAAPKESESRASREYDEIDGVIITHDGREVDPSDHLPMNTWAPEPDSKPGKTPAAATRPALSGPQPLPSSGRKALRIRERPASSMPPSTYIMPDAQASALPPPGTGRNRLQKKANRNSAMPVMMSGANGPGHSPLAPLTQPHGRDDFVARPPARASTLDYENRAPAPMYDMPPGLQVGRDHSASAPPIPAKIPIPSGGALVPMGYGEGGGDAALMEEMSRIDIGSGRARRHAQRPAIGGY